MIGELFDRFRKDFRKGLNTCNMRQMEKLNDDILLQIDKFLDEVEKFKDKEAL